HAVGMAISSVHRALHASLLASRDAVALMGEDPNWRRVMAMHPNRLIRVIPNGIVPPRTADKAAIERYRRMAQLPQNVQIIGSIGRLVSERRPDLLMKAFASLG